MSSPLTLYHGTAETHIPNIRENGLQNPYLTDDVDLAWDYAEQVAEDHDSDPAVLTVTVQDVSLLRYDGASMDEPVMVDTARRDRAWQQAAQAHPEWLSEKGWLIIPPERWEISLAGASAVRLEGTISADNITQDGHVYG